MRNNECLLETCSLSGSRIYVCKIGFKIVEPVTLFCTSKNRLSGLCWTYITAQTICILQCNPLPMGHGRGQCRVSGPMGSVLCKLKLGLSCKLKRYEKKNWLTPKRCKFLLSEICCMEMMFESWGSSFHPWILSYYVRDWLSICTTAVFSPTLTSLITFHRHIRKPGNCVALLIIITFYGLLFE